MLQEDFFKNIESQYQSQLPFVAYRKPREVLVKAIFQVDEQLHTVTDFTENGFVFAPFDATEKTILFPSENCQTIISECLFSSENTSTKNFISTGSNSQEEHINLVQKGIEHINTGALKKVVLSRVEKIPISEDNSIQFFKSLLQKYQDAFVYVWYHPKIGLWLGATPETLLNVEGQRFKTMSLAGTKKYDNTKDIPWGTKETDEQQIVTDYIVNNLQDVVDDIKATDTKTVKAGELLHLQSKISGVLKSGQLKPVIDSLHPTPAICGLPKAEAKNFILNNENYNREFYTGFLGELNFKTSKSRNTNRRNVENNAYSTVKNTSELFVNLRCMQIKKEQAHIYVGGGITKDSNPKLEWEETVSKTQTMLSVLL
nr:chorismate-binding protein [uncultured Psychroserpens sp.]